MKRICSLKFLLPLIDMYAEIININKTEIEIEILKYRCGA